MANTQAISGIMKQVALGLVVDSKALKGALALVTGTNNGTIATYGTMSNELAATGNYVAGGATVTNANAAGLTSTTAYWTPSASIVYPANMTSSGAFDAMVLYSTTDTNRVLGVFTFGSQTVTNGTFTLTMPTNDSTNGLIRFA